MEPVIYTPGLTDHPMAGEVDRIIRAELKARAKQRKNPPDINRINATLEARNRQIVESHQQERVAASLAQFLSTFFQIQPGGALHVAPGQWDTASCQIYAHKCERFETLFTAAVMSLSDDRLSDLIFRERDFFNSKLEIIHEIHQLSETVQAISRKAEKKTEGSTESEAAAREHLMAIAPLSRDLAVIESRCDILKADDYVIDAVRNLQQQIAAAYRTLAEKRKKSSTYLFEKAGSVYQRYRSLTASVSNMDALISCQNALEQYARMFDSVGDAERGERIRRFIETIRETLGKLQEQIEKQKAYEARQAEKQQDDLQAAYDRFLEVRSLFAEAQLVTESQKKNAGAILIKSRDALIAGGQRVMARDVERFMNATGLGKPAPQPAGDTFDYRKGFRILLTVTVALLLILMAMMVIR